MALQFTISTDFLEALDPPATFPPVQEQLNAQLEDKFLGECEKFISNERMLFRCSKSIETRLKTILTNSESIQNNLSTQKQKFISINHQLEKYREQRDRLREREKMLKVLCELIKMEQVRKDLLLLGGQHKPGQRQLKNPQPVNEDEYLGKLQKLSNTIEQSSTLSNFSQEFPLIQDIIHELESIFRESVQHLLKELMTPTMVELSLNKYSYMFFKDGRGEGPFYEAMIKSRTQHMKINLNPLINSLNYASNIPQLYESILTNWVQLLQQDVVLLSHSQQLSILITVQGQLLIQLIPKMEKNIFRIKDLVQVVRIRKSFSDFRRGLQQLVQIQPQQPKEQREDIILLVIGKTEAIIESMMREEAEALQNSKYNIYTLVSYIPIRQHLERVKQCHDSSIEQETIDWEAGFYILFSSRDPKNYPNNKSLVIFNLNIWYLYLKVVVGGKYRKEGEEVIRWCKQTFTNINVAETHKKYYESFEKLLQMGGNISAFKTILYAEIQLLGHEQLRRDIALSIKEQYLSTYDSLLSKIDKQPMNNEEVKSFCLSKKINLNKFGKFSQSVCIFSREQLEAQLEYQ